MTAQETNEIKTKALNRKDREVRKEGAHQAKRERQTIMKVTSSGEFPGAAVPWRDEQSTAASRLARRGTRDVFRAGYWRHCGWDSTRTA